MIPRVFIPYMVLLTNKILGDPKPDTKSQQTLEEMVNTINNMSSTEKTEFIKIIKELIKNSKITTF